MGGWRRKLVFSIGLLLLALAVWVLLWAPSGGQGGPPVLSRVPAPLSPPSASPVAPNAAARTVEEPELPTTKPVVSPFLLQGLVRFPGDGRSTAGALVLLVPEGGSRPSTLLHADAAGGFTWRSPEAEVSLRAWALLPGIGVASRPVAGAAGEETSIDLCLEPFLAQPVIVRDAGGAPLRGALVEVNGREHPVARLLGLLARSRTDPAGRMSFSAPPGLPLRLRAQRLEDPEEVTMDLAEAPGPSTPVEIRFPSRVPGGRGELSALVVGPGGAPLAGVFVHARECEPASGAAIGRGAATDAGGRIAFPESADGPFALELRPRAAGDWIEKSRAHARPGEEARLEAVSCGVLQVCADPTAEGPWLTIIGYMPEAGVSKDDTWARTAMSARTPSKEDPYSGFRAFLPPGNWSTLLLAKDRVPLRLDFKITSGEVTDLGTAPLDTGARLVGRIVLPEEAGRPRLVYLPRDGEGEPVSGLRFPLGVGRDGILSTGAVIPPGRGWLHVSAEGCAPLSVAVASPGEGATVDVGAVVMSKGGTILVRGEGTGWILLIPSDGSPTAFVIPSLPCDLSPTHDWMYAAAEEAGRGLYRLSPVAPGKYTLRCRLPLVGEGTNTTLTCTVREGETTILDR